MKMSQKKSANFQIISRIVDTKSVRQKMININVKILDSLKSYEHEIVDVLAKIQNIMVFQYLALYGRIIDFTI